MLEKIDSFEIENLMLSADENGIVQVVLSRAKKRNALVDRGLRTAKSEIVKSSEGCGLGGSAIAGWHPQHDDARVQDRPRRPQEGRAHTR